MKFSYGKFVKMPLAIDSLGSVLAHVGTECRVRICYTPFGYKAYSVSGVVGFSGEAMEKLNGLYLAGNGYRVFNTGLARFGAPDDASPFGVGGLNSYAYCGADPVNRVDPSGHGWVNSLSKFFSNVRKTRIRSSKLVKQNNKYAEQLFKGKKIPARSSELNTGKPLYIDDMVDMTDLKNMDLENNIRLNNSLLHARGKGHLRLEVPKPRPANVLPIEDLAPNYMKPATPFGAAFMKLSKQRGNASTY